MLGYRRAFEEHYLILIFFSFTPNFFLSFIKHFLKIKCLFLLFYQYMSKHSLMHFDDLLEFPFLEI